MKYPTLFLCVLFARVLLPNSAWAAVRINEVAWMGTAASQYSEWIELYNDGTDSVSLDGWKIYKTGNVLLYTLSKTISADGYLLIERITATAPDAVPNVNDESGTFGGGGLRNTGEDITLRDKDGNTINVLPFASGWPAGDVKTKDTMQWTGSKWITAPGTPDAQNAKENISVAIQTLATQTLVVQPPVISINQPDPETSTSLPTVPVAPITSQKTPLTPVVAISTPVSIPTPVISDHPPIQVSAAISSSVKKYSSSTIKKVTPPTDPVPADALQDPSAQADPVPPKENNHTKILIFGAVILIGTALFLLLERLKAQQE